MARARLALLTLEALPNAAAVRRFVAAHATDLVLVAVSDPLRPGTGVAFGQLRRHLARSGPRFVPYLAVNFGLPELLGPLATAASRVGRTRSPSAMPLRTLCRRLDVPFASVADVNGAPFRERLTAAAPDLVVTFHFDQILTADTLAIPRLGGINVHPGALPRHRGPVPTIHALADGDRAFAVTVHRLVPQIDAGAILAVRALDLPAGVSASAAAAALHGAAVPLLADLLAVVATTGALPSGTLAPVLPYRPWPDRALLRDMARRGLRLTDAGDVAAALRLPFAAAPTV